MSSHSGVILIQLMSERGKKIKQCGVSQMSHLLGMDGLSLRKSAIGDFVEI